MVSMQTLAFTDILPLIADRSDALRQAARDAGLDAQVPSCPDWTVRDLIAHLGEVQRSWAAEVQVGEEGDPGEIPDREPSGDLFAWSATATQLLTGALAEAGPDRPCWTWWESSGAPQTSGAIGRHQVQEAAVHAYDAQLAAGHPQPLPAPAAADGIGEYLTVYLPTNGAWQHEPATVLVAPEDADSWLIRLGPDGAAAEPVSAEAAGTGAAALGGPTAVLRGSASDLVLAFYRRELIGKLSIDGDADTVGKLLDWPELS
jgi:uncharacterized protein (TIGR03083 family)